MDIIINSLHPLSVIALAVMIVSLLIAYLKKTMITYAIIIANIIVFVFTILSSVVIEDLGFRPIYLSVSNIPQLYTLFSSMFLHGGFAHIFGNMLVFFFMGMAFEQRIGRKNFLMIYLVTGVCGALAHSMIDLNSSVPLVGASGAIFGILGSFAFLYPYDEVVMPIPIGIMIITKIKVIYAAAIFAGMETIIVWWESTQGVQSSTAHFAHVGGLVSGVIIAGLLFRRQKKKGETIQQPVQKRLRYDSFQPEKPSPVNYEELQKLAQTTELKEMLEKIKQETVPQVRDIWLEHFLEKTVCPKCGKPLQHIHKKIWCDHCGFKTKF